MSTEVNLNVGALCPICERGRLVLVEPEIWHCDRKRCNNEFFLDPFEDARMLNVRDKPQPPSLLSRVAKLFERKQRYAADDPGCRHDVRTDARWTADGWVEICLCCREWIFLGDDYYKDMPK